MSHYFLTVDEVDERRDMNDLQRRLQPGAGSQEYDATVAPKTCLASTNAPMPVLSTIATSISSKTMMM